MKYLLYCIFQSPIEPRLEIPPGVEGEPVFVVAENGLGAALSRVPEPEGAPDIPTLLAYERVIEAFHRQRAVIPVRYGCRLANESEGVNLLKKRGDEFRALLRELAGLVEVGVRVLLEGSEGEIEGEQLAISSPASRLFDLSGAAYLEVKRKVHCGHTQATLPSRWFVDKFCRSLAGLFARHKVEFPQPSESALLSMYFLVPRGSVASFFQAAREVCAQESAKLLLTGPWPVYNFVDCLDKNAEEQAFRMS